MRSISHRKNPLIRTIVAAAAAAFLLIAFAPDARAADSGAKPQDPKWYFSLSVPVMFIDDSDSVEKGTARQIPYTANALTEYATGYRVSGSLGREFGNGLRVDGEMFLASAKVDKLIYKGRTTNMPGLGTIPVPGDYSIPVSGSASQMGAMVNVWYDFNTGSKWRPYVGFGLGFLRVDWGDVTYNRDEVARGAAHEVALIVACRDLGLPPGCLPPAAQDNVKNEADKLLEGAVPDLSATDTVLAYQLGLGLAYEYSDAITFQVGYRLSRSGDLEFSGKDTMATATATTDMQVHLFELGIRYRF